MSKFKVGERVKNRFRQDQDFKYTTFGTVVGNDGCLVLIKIDGRCYKGLLTEYNHCVPEDWSLLENNSN